MPETLVSQSSLSGTAIAVHLIRAADWEAASWEPQTQAAAALAKFTGKAGQIVLVPDGQGGLAKVLYGIGEEAAVPALRPLPAKLPPGDYAFADLPAGLDPTAAAVAWSLGSYRFDRYKQKRGDPAPRLIVPDGANAEEARAVAHACALARDMVNTPANDMGPLQMETIAREIAESFGARIAVVTGEALIEAGYPAVHAVGRAAVDARAPRMIEISWGDSGPVVALVGKGVVFDTGGLDIKPSAGMRWMKKDMGGAAHALALGRMVMAANLPVRLTILLAVVENAIAGDAMRPGDVLASRKGLSIEVGNTDAEGRLVLADALARAAELEPDLTIDLATLTGAARAALGPELPPFYTGDDALADQIAAAAMAQGDPLWRMPLWAGYETALDSDIADIKNDPDPWAQAGSVTAALFLKRFAPDTGAWVHFDIFAWSGKGRPGWPAGAEAQAIRALYAVLKARYA
ncbi:MAG TPA: leucyl aminopeptidase family protein [Caulobacteraceae bacterium]